MVDRTHPGLHLGSSNADVAVVSVGSTITLTATAKDQTGATFAGCAGGHVDLVTHEGDDPCQPGVVTGVANGSSTITATIDPEA